MTLVDQLDAQMKAQLRSRYRPLPHVMPDVMAGPIEQPKRPTVAIFPTTMKLPKIQLAVAPPARPPQSESHSQQIALRKTIARVLEVVSNVTGATIGEMQGLSVAHRISRPRQLAYALLRSEAKASLTAIGHHLGGKDHTSVRTGAAKTRMRIAAGDPQTVAWMAACQEQLAAK